MNEQNEHQSDDQQADAEGHRYVPKDERAGAGADAEGHKRLRGRIDDADEGDMITDTDGHKRHRGRLDDADEGDMTGDLEGHKRRSMRIDDADEGDMTGDLEGHGSGVPGDPVNEPSAVRGRDGQGRR